MAKKLRFGFKFPTLALVKAPLLGFTVLLSLLLGVALLLVSVEQEPFLPPRIPLWFTHPWGEAVLTWPRFIFLLPIFSLTVTLLNFLIAEHFLRKRFKEIAAVFTTLSLAVALITLASGVSLISRVSTQPPLPPYTLFANIIFPLLTAFLLSLLASPLTLKLMNRFKVIDDPKKHQHPAMLISQPVARGGSLAFLIGFLATGLLLVPIQKKLIGIYLGTALATLVGIWDDKISNRRDLSPYFRLGLLVLAAGLVVGAGVGINYLNNPFGKVIQLDHWRISFNFWGQHTIVILADIFALVWIVGLANMLSWSNGIDGQYSGVAGITALAISLVALKTGIRDSDPTQFAVAQLAAIAAGAALGLTPFTWHPQKFLWGFGATAVGIAIGGLSILSLSKVFTVAMVLLIPLFDAIVTFARRIAQGKSPVWGDRGHLHHRLLDRGWPKPTVAFFYWLVTGILATFAVISVEADLDLAVVRIGLLAAFILVLINLKGERDLWRLKIPGLKVPKIVRSKPAASGENQSVSPKSKAV